MSAYEYAALSNEYVFLVFESANERIGKIMIRADRVISYEEKRDSEGNFLGTDVWYEMRDTSGELISIRARVVSNINEIISHMRRSEWPKRTSSST